MGELIRYRWRYYCEIRKKFITTKHLLTEDLIRKEHPDAEPVPGSRTVMEINDNDQEASRPNSILRDAPIPWWKRE